MPGLVLDIRKTYLARIMGSVGSEGYKSCYFRKPDGESVDVCEGGLFPCAFFLSCILKERSLVDSVCVTVDSLEKVMCNCGWEENTRWEQEYIKVGSVIFWEPRLGSDGNQHRHVGFYLGGHDCVSADPETGVVIGHDLEFVNYKDGEKRCIKKVYYHQLLWKPILEWEPSLE